MSNLHLATPPETPARLRPRPRRIRIPLAILGLLLVVACALGFGTILTQVGQQHQVLVLSHPVDVGDVITASDLGLATVSTGTSGIAFITARNESTVIGRPAAVAMPAGAPLIAADLATAAPPGGRPRRGGALCRRAVSAGSAHRRAWPWSLCSSSRATPPPLWRPGPRSGW